MAEETREAQESIARWAQEIIEHLPEAPEQFAERMAEFLAHYKQPPYAYLWTHFIQNYILSSHKQPKVSRLEVHDASTGRLTLKVFYSNQPMSPDLSVFAYLPQSGEISATESQPDNPSAFDEAAAGELITSALREVDEIIQRLRRGRSEIDRLREETRSNISELQQMVTA